MYHDIQYIVDQNGKQVSAIVPIEEWNAIEQAKNLFEHIYISGLIDDRKDDPVSCSLDDLLTAEGISRDELDC